MNKTLMFESTTKVVDSGEAAHTNTYKYVF